MAPKAESVKWKHQNKDIRLLNTLFIIICRLSNSASPIDNIDRISLWDLIRITGMPPKLCRLLELLYSDSESCVRVGNDLSEWFSISSGVRQGCVVAPDLFNCVIDHLMCQLKTAAGPSLGIDLDNWRLTDMDYADDIALFSPSSEDLSFVLRILSKEASKVGMSISWTKTKAMMISPSSAIATPVNIDGELVEFVPSFTYLGSIICRRSHWGRNHFLHWQGSRCYEKTI